MGKKRKHEKSEEEILRKIQKLQKQLSKAKNLTLSSSEEDFNYLSQERHDLSAAVSLRSGSQSPTAPEYADNQLHLLSPNPASPDACSPRLATSPPVTSQSPIPGTSTDVLQTENTEEKQLDEDILQLLGDVPKANGSMGPPIHKDVANRWHNILANGLAKDVKDNILKQYLVPANCDLLLAPALNLEVKAALQESLVKRDSSIMNKQKQLGTALSALASATELILSNETSKQKLLKPISDACRILCDSHNLETKTRRSLVITSINTQAREALLETKRDQLLFGDNVAEKLKAAKNIQQSGNALKHPQKTKTNRPNITPKPSLNKNHLNFIPLHRKSDNRPSDTRRASRPMQRASHVLGSNSRRPSPPPRATTHRR